MKLRPYLIPKLSVKVNSELNYSITVFNWPLPDDHEIYKKHCRTLRNTSISSLLKEIAEFCVCSGKKESMESSRVHSIPLEINENDNNPYISEEIYRSKDCHALSRLVICDNCCNMERLHLLHAKKITKNIDIPAKSKAPLSSKTQTKLPLP